jgi:minor extracellular serine protease Vpr
MRNFILWVWIPLEKFFPKKSILLCFPAVIIYVMGYAQIRTPEDKIDPAFKFGMARSNANARQAPKNFSPMFKVTPVKVLVKPGQPAEERYECIIYTSDVTALRNNGVIVNSVLPRFVTAWVTAAQMEQLSKLPTVNYIAAPEMDQLHNDIAVANTGASLLHQGKLNNTVYKGKGVIVAIFDSGIDWKHPDFRDPNDTTKSRILRIWDQTITAIAGEAPPAGFTTGVEYTQEQINDELDGTPTGYVREMDINGHGTHVAGTAAGNGNAIPATRKYTGMAPEADIVVVKGGNGSFSTSNIINGITYLKNLATILGKPIVLNMSLGSQFGPHDGTRAYELAVDDFTSSAPGRAVVISAGNDNGRNIHNQLLLSGSSSQTISFNVPAGTTGTNVLEYRLYVNDNSDVSATFSAPGGESVTALAGQSVMAPVLGNGFNAYVFNQIDAGNGDRYIDVYIERNGTNTASPAGTWTLSLTNNTANTLTLDGWLYYVNPDFNGTALVGGNSEFLVGSPGNATTAITVAAFVGRNTWYSYATNGGWVGPTARMDSIATFSSHGPRRDGVLKPEIAATGQFVISALSGNSTQTPADIIYPGRYVKNQGTSMSAPVVTGAVALLLQANPSASVSQLRTTLFSNTSKDVLTEMPGATPNTTWGYGRLDVYKAAGATFNCSPLDRKTYQYDASNLYSQDAGATITGTRVAVRFTPDISGRLAGAYFHTSGTKTSLVMEVHADNAGVPGTLLGTINVADTSVSLISWNYVDLSSLNIPVTSGTDYFVVVYRDASSSANWSLRRENSSLDNRSLISANGVSWSNPGFDYKIRSVVYSNAQMTGNLALANTANNRNINTSNLFIDNNCQLIAQLTPSGASPVSGSVSANVWIESGVPDYLGAPYVARHYQITPATNASTATGRITLYFTQAEFSAFNAHANSSFDLPANPTDNTGKANLRIVKFEGNSSDGTGLPGTYSGNVAIIDPTDNDIVWNADAARWEVSFNVTGFSGFIVQSIFTPLPLLVESFSGYPQESANILNWKIGCMNSVPVFDIERSANGTDFSSIGSTSAVNGCSQTFVYKDKQPLAGKNFYRIKITDESSVHYTRFILLQTGKALVTTLYPNVITKGQSIQVVSAESDAVLSISDATGRLVYNHSLATGIQNVTLLVSGSGIYFYNIQNSKGIQAAGKLIIK